MFDQVAGVEWLQWYQIVLFVVMLLVGFLGGSALLWVGVKYLAKGERAEFVPCAGTCVIIGLLGLLIGLIPLVGWIGSILVGWLMISRRHKVSFWKGALAWLPALPVAIICIALLVSAMMPSLSMAREMAKRAGCGMSLSNLGESLNIYASSNHDQLPPDSATLERSGSISPNNIRCPSADVHAVSYFYFPQPSKSADAIVACDFSRNHSNFHNVLFRDWTVRPVKDAEFRQLLAKPVNKGFAAAYNAADKDQPER